MHFRVKHVSRHIFSRPVFCEPMTIRLRPRSDGNQRLESYKLTIDPPPAGISECVDVEGNSTTFVWFSDLNLSLNITVQSTVETLRKNPFDFLLDSQATQLPVHYDADLEIALAPHRTPLQATGTVADFARVICDRAHGQSLPFLMQLTSEIYQNFTSIIREKGDPWPAEKTLAEKLGSCRDFTVLFNEACRTLGLATRFVSGYQGGEWEQDDYHLHAWSEAYLPGAGWRGFDPTNGLAVADGHVALAAGVTPALAAPTNGMFRGTDAISTFETQLVVQVTA